MADIKGIELASDIYGLEDEKARDDVETNTSAIGTLADLETTAKTNLVEAINEVKNEIPTTSTPITVTVNGISLWAKKSGNVVTVCYNGVVDQDEVGAISYAGVLPADWRPTTRYIRGIVFDDENRPNGICYVSITGDVNIYAQLSQDWSQDDSISGTVTFVV